MSSTMIGGRSAAIFISASSPSTAVVTAYPSFCRAAVAIRRSVGLSSTTSTCLLMRSPRCSRVGLRRSVGFRRSLHVALSFDLAYRRPQPVDKHAEGGPPLFPFPGSVKERARRVAVERQHVQKRPIQIQASCFRSSLALVQLFSTPTAVATEIRSASSPSNCVYGCDSERRGSTREGSTSG